MKGTLKGQFGMMEHLLMAVILLMVVVAAMFFFFGFQSTKSKSLAFREDIDRIILAEGILLKSDALTREDGVFDDSKLVGFVKTDGCSAIKNITGEACIKVNEVLIGGEDENQCGPENFEQTGKSACNIWTICADICEKLKTKNSKGLSIPMNIFRKLENKVDLGILTVGVPT